MVTKPSPVIRHSPQVLTLAALNGYAPGRPALWIAGATHRQVAAPSAFSQNRADGAAVSFRTTTIKQMIRTDVDLENKLAPLLDHAHLDAQTFGDADLAREVLSLFEDQCRRLLPAMAEASRPTEERADLAHTLKGAALGVGAMQVAEVSTTVETGFRTVGEADLEALRSAVAETLAALAAPGLEM